VTHQGAHFDSVPLQLHGFLNVKLNCAITLEINQSLLPPSYSGVQIRRYLGVYGRLLHVAVLCLRPHTSDDMCLESKEQHDTGRVILGSFVYG
jgi:hypothetical protein